MHTPYLTSAWQPQLQIQHVNTQFSSLVMRERGFLVQACRLVIYFFYIEYTNIFLIIYILVIRYFRKLFFITIIRLILFSYFLISFFPLLILEL